MNSPLSSEALIAQLQGLSHAQRRQIWEQVVGADLAGNEPANIPGLSPLGVAAAVDPPPLSSNAMLRALASALDLAAVEEPGARIGPYKLLEQIGEGGFGVVWMAEQTEPIRRHVACKILKVGMDTREVIARFEVERQALALMDHPNIARVLDAGATEHGRSYFVMELVRGVAITHYCDAQRLATTERLKLFITVCRAVQHAHQKGVIHRDLKPSNILITLHDGVPVPKIIDFGIAKATQGRLTDKTLFTHFHAFLGTPAYASPEQMEMSGLDLDTRSDIYSLGALLYELLAGRPPFDPATLASSGLDEMRRTICEVDPPWPSVRLAGLSDADCVAVTRERSADRVKLAQQLRGDLDSIVMRCLEKDRARRYESASALAADVQRHLDDEPIMARPPNAADRLRKSIRRHRFGYVVGALGVISLCGGTVMLATMLRLERAAHGRETTLRGQAEASAVTARTEAARNAEVVRFMREMLNGVKPSRARGRDTSMLADLLDETRGRLDTELRDQPLVAADLRETLGAVYRDLGRSADAEPLVRAAVEARRKTGRGETAELAFALNLHGDILARRPNQAVEAEAALQEALAIRRKLGGDADPAVADSLFHLAVVTAIRGSLVEAEKILQQVLAIRRRALGHENAAVAETLAALGNIARDRTEHERAVDLHTEALAMTRKFLGENHPAVGESLDSLGYSLLHFDRKGAGLEHYREAFLLKKRFFGYDHPRMITALLRYVGQIPAAEADEPTIERVRSFVAEQRKILPRGSPLLAPALITLATLLDQPTRDPARARALVTEARTLVLEATNNGLHLPTELLEAMALYGWWKFMGRHSAEGIAMCELGALASQRALPSHDRRLVLFTHNPGLLLLDAGRFDEAVAALEAVVRIGGQLLTTWHVYYGLDLANLGRAYRKAGRLEDSRRVLEQALEAWHWGKHPEGQENKNMPAVLGELGLTLHEMQRYPEAERVLRQAIEGYEKGGMKVVAKRALPRGIYECGLGRVLAQQAKFVEAEPRLLQGFEELKRDRDFNAGDTLRDVREARDALLALYTAWGRPEKVAEWKAARP